ncbi:hypothetical protein FHS95_003192 [Sphingomonas naasensis]|nr:DUF2924 domain-containing protein [Sphingomonas naasensis]NIJ21489.1 hypothetical protein [Sphingomonas naasensis]
MPTIEVDFDTFKAITARRPDESVTEGDVVRSALGLPPKKGIMDGIKAAFATSWLSEGVAFKVGQELQHRFRGGKTAIARITAGGVEFEGKVYGGLSPAAKAAAGHEANGWQFWEVHRADGSWVKADTLRS